MPTPPPAVATPSSTATPTPSPAPPLPAAGPGLAVGLTEFNANLVASPATKQLPPPWAGVRDALGAIKPAFFRLVIDWRSIQPTADQPANLDAPHTGCVRDVGPCLEFGGVRELLKALASRQAEGGWETLVVITDTPDWAAAPAGGCERETTQARNRPPRADALGAYRQLVADLLAAATQQGAALRYWSPWNEPNLPPFISPQRAACDTASPSLAPAVYAQIAEAMIGALDDAPGDQQLVIGETAGILKSTKLVTSVPEFIAGLPENIVCASTVYTQHAYVGGPDPVDAVADALAKRNCPHRAHDLDHRDRRRPGAQGVLGHRRSHHRLPRPARPPRPVVQRPARDRRLPVHVPRGRQVPHGPVLHRPHHAPPGAGRVDRLGRRTRTDRAPAAGGLLNLRRGPVGERRLAVGLAGLRRCSGSSAGIRTPTAFAVLPSRSGTSARSRRSACCRPSPVWNASLRLSRVMSPPLTCGLLPTVSLNQFMTMLPWPLPPSEMRSRITSSLGRCDGFGEHRHVVVDPRRMAPAGVVAEARLVPATSAVAYE